jgi:hypothetical protein
VSDAPVAIANLIARYAECIDTGDFEGVADLLAGAAVGTAEEGAPLLSGRSSVLALYEATTRRYEDGTPGTKHVTTNLILEIDEEAGTAAARSYWLVLQAVAGLPLQPILAGRYRDRFTRTDGRWAFTERRFVVDLVGDVGHHLLTPLPPAG